MSAGTATVAMVLNGLGFSNRRLYLVPQFFANKPVELLLGEGIEAEDLNDDCRGRTLDWTKEAGPARVRALPKLPGVRGTRPSRGACCRVAVR